MLSIENVNNEISISVVILACLEYEARPYLQGFELKLTLPDVATICCGSVFPEKLPNNGD